jgi:phage head maturation protease
VISTGDIGRDGAIIEPAGWDFDNYNRNPVVLWMHDDDVMPFAKTVDLMATAKELVARAEFDMEDPLGAIAFRKISNGFVNSTSVRWLPKKTEVRTEGEGDDKRDILVFLEQELLEWSFVTIPADPSAMIVRADGAPFSAADYREPTIDLNMAWLGNLSPADFQEQAERLYKPPNGHKPAADIKALEKLLVRHFERRSERPDAEEMLVSSLSKITGKSPERIRQEIAK